MPTAIPTGFTQVASMNDKSILAQVSSITSNGKPYLDTSGIELSQDRRNSARSLRQQVRRLSDVETNSLYLRTHVSIIVQSLIASPPASAGAFVTAVQTALASASGVSEADPQSDAPSISEKKLISALIFLDGSGQLAIDNIGGSATDGTFRPNIGRSARHQFRRVLVNNGDDSLRIATASGLIARSIAASGATVIGDINTAISGAITASTSSTSISAVPAKAKSTSFLNQLQDLMVIASDTTIAIDDTGETTLTRAQLKASQRAEIKRIIQSNGEATPTFRIQTTSGMKWNKVADLDSGTATVADILAAFTAAA